MTFRALLLDLAVNCHRRPSRQSRSRIGKLGPRGSFKIPSSKDGRKKRKEKTQGEVWAWQYWCNLSGCGLLLFELLFILSKDYSNSFIPLRGFSWLLLFVCLFVCFVLLPPSENLRITSTYYASSLCKYYWIYDVYFIIYSAKYMIEKLQFETLIHLLCSTLVLRDERNVNSCFLKPPPPGYVAFPASDVDRET